MIILSPIKFQYSTSPNYQNNLPTHVYSNSCNFNIKNAYWNNSFENGGLKNPWGRSFVKKNGLNAGNFLRELSEGCAEKERNEG